MKTSLGLAGMLLLLLVQVGGTQEDAKKELKRMGGTWIASLVETGGKLATAEQAKFKLKLVVNGNTYKIFFEEKQLVSGVMAVDPNKKPRTIDVFPLDGPDKGKVQPGIYQFIGEEMRVVFANPGQPRPTEFRTRAGTEETYMSYQRAKVK